MTIRFVTLTACAAALVTVPATAQDAWRVGNDQYHLYNSDLDVNSEAGRAAMLARVEKAAAKLCDPLRLSSRKRCIAATVADAARTPRGAPLALALSERGKVLLASR